ncbi:CvpA family protein [Rhodobacter sp. KR11]|jgi:membrane protein required for colicin V production|uniref:CvpA family protein n=1 Tax=Rhodobacter sp. KR11 TaxID=2974588 RepID=UPI002223CAB7|nr:CvpA family protein [Rhodobacter sp. KR11]MCW1917840.1 CvpA family protein [Rhodobacter sp. KR11]
MDSFTIVDGVVAGVILLSAILAYSRGVVREIMAIAGWVGAAVLAYVFAGAAQPLVKEIPVLNKMIGENCELSIIAAFLAVFAVGLILASLFTPLFSSVVQRSVLGGLDQALGFFFGAARGILLVAAAFVVYGMAQQEVEMVDKSRSAQVFAGVTGDVQGLVPTNLMATIQGQYEQLTGVCRGAGGTTAPQTGTTTGG